jgi:NAD(P)-dependent dehydrogenase (short-subunit alcohol dehydrogenase family)
VVCDVRSDDSVASVFAKVESEQGRFDVLVNSAFDLPEGCLPGTHDPPSSPGPAICRGPLAVARRSGFDGRGGSRRNARSEKVRLENGRRRLLAP